MCVCVFFCENPRIVLFARGPACLMSEEEIQYYCRCQECREDGTDVSSVFCFCCLFFNCALGSLESRVRGDQSRTAVRGVAGVV